MKKHKKSIILTGIGAMVIGVTALTQGINPINESIEKEKNQAYNHKPANILDNVFIENNTNYLPFIFTDSTNTISESTIRTAFSKKGLTIKSISTGSKIATGTKITTSDNKVYKVVIYGDVNGDGKVNLIDAQRLILHFLEPQTKKLEGIYAKAGNVNNNSGIVNLVDAQRVILFFLDDLETGLVTNEPKSSKELDSTKPVINLVGNSEIILNVGGTYTEQGATASDNYDGNITSKIVKTGTVNTKVVGTYKIQYNVTDSNGNKANTVTRTIKVVDKTKPTIKLNGNPEIIINVGGTYTDKGATASDNYDGDITSKIVKTGTVKANVVGTYKIQYNVTDSNGNKADTVTRTIKVVDKTKPEIKLIGNKEITLYKGQTYIEQGATATDNYDGNISIKVVKTGQVDTSKVGTYTVKYDVTDISGNKADTVTRTIIVKEDGVANIAMSSNLQKTQYNYGEKEIDLTGAQIKVTWLSGKITYVDVKDNMISGFEPTTSGTQKITVSYEGKTAQFYVKVLNKIQNIELTADNRDKIELIEGKYETNSNIDFVLGTIKEKEQTDGSKLQKDQLIINTSLINSEEDDATLTITPENKDNVIILKGKASKPGNYKVEISFKYGEEEIPLDETITISAKKSIVVDRFELETIADSEIRINNPVQKAITIHNINNETIDVTAAQIIIKNKTEGITVTKLKTDGTESNLETDIVKSLKITTDITELKNEKESFTVEIGGKEQTYSFIIGEKLVLKNIQIDATNIDISLEEETVVPIKFLNQLGEEMNIKASDVISFTGNSASSVTLEDEQICFLLPTASAEITIEGLNEPIITNDAEGIVITKYDEFDNPLTDSTTIKKIGFSANNKSSSVKVILSSLEGKKIYGIWKNQTESYEIPITVKYETITKFTFDDSTKQNVTINESDNYSIFVGEDATLGTLGVGENQGPLTADMIQKQITPNTGLNVTYVEENGKILMKAIAEKIGQYEVKSSITVGEKTFSKTVVIDVEESVKNITDVNIQEEITSGATIQSSFGIIRESSQIEGLIQSKYVTIEPDSGVTVEKLDALGIPIGQRENEQIAYLRIQVEATEETSKNIKFIFNDGTNNKEITKTITILPIGN